MSNITRWDPYAELTALQRQFFGNDLMASTKNFSLPTTDVYTQDNNLVVEAHLPNFEKSDVDIQIDGNSLIIQAEKHEKEEDKSKQFVVRESSSSFYRKVTLPKRADAEGIDAHLDDGVLKVTVPLTPIPEPKKVEVKTKKLKK